MKNRSGTGLIKAAYMPVLVVTICMLLIFGAYIYYYSIQRSTREDKRNDLKIISNLMVEQITLWQRQRLGDAQVISNSPFFNDAIKRWIDNKTDKQLENKIIRRLQLVKSNFTYQSIILTSTKGDLFISTESGTDSTDTFTRRNIIKSISENKINYSDFYYCFIHNQVHDDIIAPVQNNKGLPVAALVLRDNPQNYLSPLVKSWPISNVSGEVLIVRKDRDSVVFLTELRNHNNSSFFVKIPLSKDSLLAVQSVLGKKGFTDGIDFKGVKVLAYTEPIPDTDWYLIVKINKNELYRDLYFRTIIISVFILIMIILLYLGLHLIYSSRQKNIYQELHVSEIEWNKNREEHKTILYSIGDGVISTNVHGLLTGMNPVAEKLTGWKEAEGIGKPVIEIFNIITEESRNRVVNPVDRILKEGLTIGLANHTLLVNRQGKEIPIADSGAPIKNSSGELLGVVLVFRDQTEERAAAKKIMESEKKFRNMFEHSPVGKSLTTMDGLMSVNKSFSLITGYSEEELNAKTWMEISHPDDIQLSKDAIQLLLDGKRVHVHFEKRYLHKNGNIVWTDVYTSLQHNEESKSTFFITNIIDITKRKLIEEENRKLNEELENRVIQRTAQLEASNKELEAFSYSVSHDLRAPLRHISGYVDLLKSNFFDSLPDKARHYLDTISESSGQMGKLIDDLLQFSHTGRQELQEIFIDMNMLFHEVHETATMDNNDRLIEWIIPNLPSVFGDYAMLKLVWLNLLSNALKYSRNKEIARIEVGWKQEGREIIFFIQDNGAGFDMRYAHKLFGVFQRLHSSQEYEGTGIGLANVRRIIMRHGGRTWAEAELDKGATFYFTLLKK